MKNISVNLQPLVTNLNLPTVIKTANLPGDSVERMFIATQVGEIYFLGNGTVEPFLDIRDQVIELGRQSGGYDERGLLGLAFHPSFSNNGRFYIHYSLAGSQGPGALQGSFSPNPCDIDTLTLSWQDRENAYDHIDTVEEWTMITTDTRPQKIRTILNLRRPFMNHNGVNSLTFSPETGNLILTTGDGGSGYDPFNLSQDLMEIAGKIIEIDVDMNTNILNPPVVSRFDELPTSIQETLRVVAKGIRNSTGLVYQWNHNQFFKYIGQVGQDLVESVYFFIYYTPIAVTTIVENPNIDINLEHEGFINLGWRGWEGDLPTPIPSPCPNDSDGNRKILAYYNEAVDLTSKRIYPLVSYFHDDPRQDKFQGSAITGTCPYMGDDIPELSEALVFSDFMKRSGNVGPGQGGLGYTRLRPDCHPNDYYVIEPTYDFGDSPAYFTCLGGNLQQTRMYLGVYASANVTDYNMGTVFEILPSN